MKTKGLKKVTIIMLVVAIVVMQISALAITLAWFTDKKTDQKTLDLGNIKLKAGENGTSTSMGINLTRADGTTVATKALPGDKIKVTIGVELESTSKPAYYLVYLDDADMFSCDKEFFFKNGDTVYATDGTTTNKLNQDGTLDTTTSSEVVGKIEANQTHTIEFIQQIDKTKTEVDFSEPKQLACTVYAIQQANITPEEAYTEIYNKEYATVTLAVNSTASSGSIRYGSFETAKWMKSTGAHNYKKVSFYRTGRQPSNLVYQGPLNVNVSGGDKGKISIYVSPQSQEMDEIAFVSDYRIWASDNGNVLFAKGSDCESTKIEEINLANFYTNNVQTMAGIFANLNNLKKIDLSKFENIKVSDMSSMFNGCSLLTNLDLSGLDTSNVTDMAYMFFGCTSLTSLDMSNFDTINVTSMYHMFDGCSSLTNLNLSSFNTSNVTDMGDIFKDCISLTTLDTSNFDFGKLTIVDDIFRGLSKLETLKLTNGKGGNSMSSMFLGCRSLTSLDLSNFDTSNVTYMPWMCQDCSSLTTLDLSSFDTSNVTSMGNMFNGCTSLTNLNLSSFNTSNVTNMVDIFKDCTSLTTLDMSNFDFSKLPYSAAFPGLLNEIFSDLSKLETLKLTNGKGGADMTNMFAGLNSLTSLDLSNFDTSNVTKMSSMFSNCFSNNPSGSELKIGDNFKYNGTAVTKSTLVSNGLNSLVKVTKNGVELT